MAERRLILGTAGHVDHGKTRLVGCLTGWETDRLKEEKERGISIELGFAPLRLDGETTVGIVDVPGHERFVKNMVAGAGGIDLAMLVVAADESVMPQTKEHLEVLASLHISSGVTVISKTDLSTADMLLIVREEVADLAKGTFLETAPIVETSAKTGEGIDALKKTLLELAKQVAERDRTGPFRLAVDRVFHMRGIGVVVTGSGYSGTVSVGDSLELLPSAKRARIREIQSFGEKRQQGYAGERLAIALQGVKLDEVFRGDMLVTPAAFVASRVLDARIHVAVYAPFELKHRERVRIHHGAKEVLGRVTLLEGDELRSGRSALVQLRLEAPIVGAEADSFVIRKYSPSIVLGGGRIIVPQASRHRRRDQAVLETLRLCEQGDPKDQLLQTIDAAGLKGVREKSKAADDVRALLDEGKIAVIDGVLFGRDALDALAGRIATLASAYVKTHPLRYGIDKEELRQKVRFPHPTSFFNTVLEEISRNRPLFVKDNRVRVGTDSVELPEEISAELSRLEHIIEQLGLLFLRQPKIGEAWQGKSALADALRYLRDAGRIERIGADGYIHIEPFGDCLKRLSRWFDENAELTVGDFKNLFGMTRKFAIPILEHLDEARITTREGNVRRRGPRFEAMLEGERGGTE